ncbi:sensor histidine kinase [Oceanisphaera avium]|uniref:histidine kinase n=1 Tax=Oceanisphaera avium TaxID=1903694 RepID=A0A1Y0CXX1_9GAMM|nr:ATP-binding protein [Oceanisphaera avium]ART79736.1 histidine kinase [Oceanisphaera avium]
MPVDLVPDTAIMTSLVNAMPSGVVWLDGRGKVMLVNPAAQTMLGDPLLYQPWSSVIARAFAPQPDDGLQVSLKNGRRIQLAIAHVEGQPGQLIQLTDLTPTRAWVEQQSHAQRLAALGQMAATLAHQIRTPLSAAMLYGANLAAPQLSEQQRNQFQQRLVARLNDIERQISDILLFARPEQAPLADTVSISELLSQCVEAAGHVLALKISLKDHVLSEGLANSQVLGNLHALKGIVLNLLENAVEAGASQVQLQLLTAPNNELEIRLQDNGKGMAAELIKRIFTPFFTTRTQGTGLGLAAVAAVMHAHQGRVSVQSTLGKGTCFSLWLPKKVKS